VINQSDGYGPRMTTKHLLNERAKRELWSKLNEQGLIATFEKGTWMKIMRDQGTPSIIEVRASQREKFITRITQRFSSNDFPRPDF